MANKRAEPLSYRRFEAKGALAEGLLAVALPHLGGDIERRLAQGWFRLAGLAGQFADRAAARDGERAGVSDALMAAPAAAELTGGANEVATASPFQTAISGGGGAKPFKTDDPVASGLASHQKALLNAIAGGESGGRYDIRYTPNGAASFADFSRHPRVMEPTKDGKKSSAAGRYQIVSTTWDSLGGGDFSPENQDRQALKLAARDYRQKTGRDLDEDLKQEGLTPRILHVLSSTWEALKHDGERHIATYNASLARYGGDGGKSGEAVASKGERAGAFSVAAPRLEPVGVVAGKPVEVRPMDVRLEKAGGFRPKNDNSAYSRAYNAAGTRTYLQQLTLAVQADVMNVYDKMGEDPAELDKGLAALKKLHLDEHAIPLEIRGDYEAAFARVAAPLQRQARLESHKRIEAQNIADFNERTRLLESERARRMAALSSDNELAVDAIWDVQAALDDHYEAAILHAVMTPDQANKAKALSRRAAAVQFYERQTEGKTAVEIKTMREEMTADFAAGTLAHLDGEGWLVLKQRLKRQEMSAAGEARQAGRDYVRRGEAMLARLEAGYGVDDAALARYALDMNKVEDGEKIHDEVMAKLSLGLAIRDMKLADAVAFVNERRAKMGAAPTDEEITLLAYAEGALETKGERLAKDPLGYAVAMRLIPEVGNVLAEITPEGVSAAMRQRVDVARQVGEHFGIAPRIFREGEIKEIGAIVEKNPEMGAMIAGAMVEGAGSDVGQVLAEFGDKAPAILQAGAILAMGGEPQAAIDVIYGSAKQPPEGGQYKNIDIETRKNWDDEVVGGALDLLPQDRERITGAAVAITKRRMYERGLDPKKDDVDDIYRQALQEAAGRTKQGGRDYGGLARIKDGWLSSGFVVKVHPNMRSDRFEAAMAAIRMSDFAEAEIKPVKFDGKTPLDEGKFWMLYPVEVEGGYRFSSVDFTTGASPRWIKGSDGNVFVYNPLDYKDVLEVRVPGAFKQ